ncbi:MAG: tetratricopeptide repeat protein [Candidatus Methylacidiphilales bacterium]
MKFYNLLIKYRFWAGLASLVIGLLLQFAGLGDIWAAIIFYTLSVIAIFTHFFIGPLRLIQTPMENGDVEEVQRIIDSIWFPNLLFKPIRSSYYTLKGNMAMVNKDFDSAEKHLKKSASIGSSIAENEGSTKVQLGMMALQKSNFKESEKYIREALRGTLDNESQAMALLGMVQIYMNKRDIRASKDFLRRAKNCKAKNEQVVAQIKDLEKHLARVPG